MAYLGLNTGSVLQLDLTSCKITKTFQPFNNNFSSIVQIKSLNLDGTKLILVSKDKYVLFDMQTQTISKHFAKSKKQQSMPSLIDLSHDDRFCIEISSEFPTSVLLRNMVTNSLIAKFEGHSQTVTSL